MNGIADGVVGDDSLLGLEMQAQQAIQAKLMIQKIQGKTIVLD
jgi:hypothetical protein